jgi:hypothetical protein
MLRVQNLLAADPLAAARGAARREAIVARVESTDLSLERAHHQLLVRRWRKELRQVFGPRRS